MDDNNATSANLIRVQLEERESAFNNRLRTFAIVNHQHIDEKEFLREALLIVAIEICEMLRSHPIFKIGTCLSLLYEKVILGENNERMTEFQTINIRTKTETVDRSDDLNIFFNDHILGEILRRIDDTYMEGSGFSLVAIQELVVNVCQFSPIGGSSFIKLPAFLANKKAIINVKNNDNECFKWAVLAAIKPANKKAERVSKYKIYEDLLNFTDIEFPVTLKQIDKFEKQNPTISIHVYVFIENKNEVQPIRLSKNVKENHIHLLLLSEINENNDTKTHYCFIKNLSALIGRQVSKFHAKKYFCDYCLNYFSNSDKLNNHKEDCAKINECKIEMPVAGKNKISFTKFQNQLKVPFVVYADIETLLKQPSEQHWKSESSGVCQEHEPYSVGYYFHSSNDESLSKYDFKCGKNCIEWFGQELKSIAEQVNGIIFGEIKMNLNDDEKNAYYSTTQCHICEKPLNGDKVRDHSHLTGKYRGAAHSNCNLNYQEPRYIPVILHNLSKYDLHFLIKKISNAFDGKTDVLPRTTELYISFTKQVASTKTVSPEVHLSKQKRQLPKYISLRFIDSFQFMSSSLNSLSSLLLPKQKQILRRECKKLKYNEEQIALLQRKGVMCYDYLNSWDKLEETHLPQKTEFANKLNESEISDEDYEFAKQIWKKFNIKTLCDYTNLYLKTDVLLLADVFDNFRETCLKNYQLDPAHYFSAPGLSFDAMLKYTKVEIELFTDVDMLLFAEGGIRGGISQCNIRHSKANNKYMPNYNENDESKFLIYLDANNLYGYSMMQPLPINNFQWCHNEFNTEKILSLEDDASIGYIFEVDLDYPKTLHDWHKDFPLCAENRIVPSTKNEKKLLLTLFNKEKYIVHYKMLKFALQQGLILKRVHRVLQFAQSKWLKPYIELNTDLRTKAKTKFEENFYKLLNNTIYGKTMENVRKRLDIRLVREWNGRFGARKMIAQSNFKKYTIFDENLVAIELKKTNIKMNKPIVIGMSVLDISKVFMYDFFYNTIKSQYGTNVRLAYTDTDSFILEIKTDCVYTDIKNNIEKYDTSNYATNNVYNMPCEGKKIPGRFKDERNGNIITEFVGLRSKVYYVKSEKAIDDIKRAKGVKKCVLKKNITFDHFMDCIKTGCSISMSQSTFRSKNHNVYTLTQNKIALDPYDNKRSICSNNTDTLPWGHYELNEQIEL